MQSLMLRRLEVDWRRVVAAKGNPYQNDLRNRSRETSLGDLVAEYRSHPTARKAPIFLSLAGRIEDLSRELPGTHPLLRRSMRKLAKQLGV